MPSDAVALQELIRTRLTLPHGLAVGAAAVADHSDALFPDEAAAIEQAADRRRAEFSTGRWLARQLMGGLGLPAVSIGRGEQREPLWPAEARGTITHVESLAAAAVARAGTAASLGLDLEAWDRVSSKVHRKILTEREVTALAGQPEQAPGLIFSAKEAGYKATFPLVGRFIGFHEAEIDVDWEGGGFRIRYLGEHAPNRVMETGAGRFLLSGRYVLSLFIIP